MGTENNVWVRLLRLGAATAVLGAGFFAYSRLKLQETPTPAVDLPVPVIATTVQQHDVPIMLTGLGTVTALNTATVRAQITGLLTAINFQEGQTVKKGEVLAQIDPRTFQAQLDQSEATLQHDQANLKNARLNLERYTVLAKDNAIARQQRDDQQAVVDELVAQIKSDQAAMESAKAQLSYTSLIAPFDGVTGIRLLDVGNIIHPPTSSTTTQSSTSDPNALVVVTEIQPISVIFTLAATTIPEVQDAMAHGPLEAVAFSQDDKSKLDTGKLLVVNNQADPGSGTVQLKAQFPNQERRLWPGTFVNVRLVLSVERGGLTVPLDAIQQGPQGQMVFVVDPDHKVSMRPVSIRQSLNGVALIDKGLAAGETVVVRGQYRLSPGTVVTLSDPNNPGAVPNPSTASSGMLP
jgi:multidrug efflux system membrane fusion protein